MRVAAFALALACLAAATVDCATSELREPTPVTVVGLYNVTGAQSSLGVPSSRGAQLAMRQINERGGVLGRRLDVRIEDGRSDRAFVAQRASDLLSLAPVAFVGLSDTDMVLAAAPPVTASGRLFLTSGATSPLLPAQIPGVSLACFGDNAQAAAAAEYAFQHLASRRALVVYDTTTEYTRLLQTYFRSRYLELGATIVSAAGYANVSELATTAAARVPTDVDMVFLASQPQDAHAGVVALRAHGFTGTVIGGDSFDTDDFGPMHPEIDHVLFTTHADMTAPDEAMRAFTSDYEQTYGDSHPSAFAALGYDTVNLLARAITLAGSSDPAAVRAALPRVTDFQGLTGTITYDATMPGLPVKSVTIIEVRNGQRSRVAMDVPQRVPSADTPVAR